MAASYSWHPGTCSVNQRWAFPVPLFPDEIMSSWLVRAALAHGCDPLVLTGEVWPKWRIWTRDTDRFISDARLKLLAAISGIQHKAFRAATLNSVASKIQESPLPEKAIWPWILAIGARNTKRRSGLQYCPLCLSDDTIPYYRIQWRFAWHTCCEHHECMLLDRCWQCSAPLEIHRLVAEDANVALCASCKAGLIDAKTTPSCTDAMAFQRIADRFVIESGGAFLGEPISVTDWFAVMDFFVSLIRRANRSHVDGLMSFMERVGVVLPKGISMIAGAGIELLRVNERQQILGTAWRFVTADRVQLCDALRESGITRQGFCAKGEPVPILLTDLAYALPDNSVTRARRLQRRPIGPRSRREVMNMLARLERKLEMKRR